MAAANGYVEVALYILSKSCKVDIQDIDGWTPLHAAAFWGEVDIIELLGAHGADFKIRTFSGERPAGMFIGVPGILFIKSISPCVGMKTWFELEICSIKMTKLVFSDEY